MRNMAFRTHSGRIAGQPDDRWDDASEPLPCRKNPWSGLLDFIDRIERRGIETADDGQDRLQLSTWNDGKDHLDPTGRTFRVQAGDAELSRAEFRNELGRVSVGDRSHDYVAEREPLLDQHAEEIAQREPAGEAEKT